MRIADTLLRGGHLSEDALADAWYTGERPAHLDRCDLCAERAVEMARWLEDTRKLGAEAADAVFTPERLAAQQSQILRKLEQLDRPSKLLSFPGATVAVSSDAPVAVHRHFAPWIAAAAAAGLILGVVAGRLSMYEPKAPVQSAEAHPTPAPAPPKEAAQPVADRADQNAEQYPGEIPQLQLNSLSALETLTPQVVVARASTTGRRR